MAEEAPLDPERPIIDPHLHLWAASGEQFFVPEAAAMIAASGHRVSHTVFVECFAMHRADGPPEFRPVGETEFVAGQALMSESGLYGPARLAHRIVGTANLMLGDSLAPVLEAHLAAGGGRFRGIRMFSAWRKSDMFGRPSNPALRGIIGSAGYREGAGVLARMGLNLDIWCFHSQLDEVIALADALPGLAIVVNHLGTPDLSSDANAALAQWRALIVQLAQRPNVTIKLGGLGMSPDDTVFGQSRGLSSRLLAENWSPMIEAAIAAFGPARAMFESNFPPDSASASYGATWNAFKRIAAPYSDDEKDALFRRTAARVYSIDLED